MPKLGTKAAVTAAHKIATILWAMVRRHRPYNPARLENPELPRARKERHLRRQAEQLGFPLTSVHRMYHKRVVKFREVKSKLRAVKSLSTLGQIV